MKAQGDTRAFKLQLQNQISLESKTNWILKKKKKISIPNISSQVSFLGTTFYVRSSSCENSWQLFLLIIDSTIHPFSSAYPW